MATIFTRRSFVAGAALGTVEVFARSLRAAEYTFTQFHNQTATSSLHKRLVEMWAAVQTETRGRVETQVFPQNNSLAGSDPAALKLLVYISLIACLFAPWALSPPSAEPEPTVLIGGIAAYVAKLGAAGVLLALFETAIAKMRVFRLPGFLGAALMLALLATLLRFVSRSF